MEEISLGILCLSISDVNVCCSLFIARFLFFEMLSFSNLFNTSTGTQTTTKDSPTKSDGAGVRYSSLNRHEETAVEATPTTTSAWNQCHYLSLFIAIFSWTYFMLFFHKSFLSRSLTFTHNNEIIISAFQHFPYLPIYLSLFVVSIYNIYDKKE